MLLPLTSVKSQTTIPIPIDVDAEINTSTPSTNSGTTTEIASRAWTISSVAYKWRGLINFNLSLIPTNTTVTNATLTLYGNGHANNTLNGSGYTSNASFLKRVTSTWDESTVTWNNQPTTTATDQVSLANSTSINQNYIVDITTLVNDMLKDPSNSYGLMLLLQNETIYARMVFGSSDNSNTALRPTLTITYNSYNYSISTSAGKNYIQTIVPLVATQQDINLSGNRDVNTISESLTYLDGLGRTMQTIGVCASPSHGDLIQPKAYDAFGRVSRQYLPYTLKNPSGEGGVYQGGAYQSTALTNQLSFYNPSTSAPNIASTVNPYADISYDNSPRNMIVEAGAQGENWQIGTNNTKKFSSKPCTTEPVHIWLMSVTSGTLATTSENYNTVNTSKLIVNSSKDEDSKEVKEYINESGQVVLKEAISVSTMLQTQYVYDDFGRLRYVVTPMATDLNPITLTPTADVVKKYCYYYEYDNKGRKIIERKPGMGNTNVTGETFFVYDKLNRPVMTQEPNQRDKTPKEWTFIKYDIYSRPIITGIDTSYHDRAWWQNTFDATGANLYEIRSTTDPTGYTTNLVNPTSGVFQYLTATYYDDYLALPAGYGYSVSGISGFTDPQYTGFTTTASTRTLGRATATQTWVLGGISGMATSMYTAIYYDDKGRVIQTVSDNHITNNGKDRVSNKYNFVGWLLATIYEHNFKTNSVTMGQRYVYDHRGRVAQEYNQIVGNNEILTCEYVYNELGQVVQKKNHKANGHDFIQFTDYKYNIRGWLKAINDANLGTQNDLFGIEYYYNEALTGVPDYTPQNNGNIAAVKWKYSGDANQKYYAYLYDSYNQLIKANYATSDIPNNNAFDVTGLGTNNTIQYDKNGNMLNIKRNDINGALKNNFAYTYDGNKLTQLNRSGTNYGYSYDANGNMTVDNFNSSLTYIYNMFNLPKQITNNSATTNIYFSGAGTKLSVMLTQGSTSTYNHYLGSFVYHGAIGSETFDFINTSFGRIVKMGSAYQYEYYITDNIGNVRVRFKDNGSGVATVLQKDDYYPHGSSAYHYTIDGESQYRFNGKELHEALGGLSVYDYGARYYDPVLGRWISQDPKTQFASPYIGIGNNPVNLIDRWGMDAGWGGSEDGSGGWFGSTGNNDPFGMYPNWFTFSDGSTGGRWNQDYTGMSNESWIKASAPNSHGSSWKTTITITRYENWYYGGTIVNGEKKLNGDRIFEGYSYIADVSTEMMTFYKDENGKYTYLGYQKTHVNASLSSNGFLLTGSGSQLQADIPKVIELLDNPESLDENSDDISSNPNPDKGFVAGYITTFISICIKAANDQDNILSPIDKTVVCAGRLSGGIVLSIQFYNLYSNPNATTGAWTKLGVDGLSYYMTCWSNNGYVMTAGLIIGTLNRFGAFDNYYRSLDPKKH